MIGSGINNQLLAKYDRLQDLVRYSQIPRSHDETVAEHSYYVALYTMQICDELELSSEQKAKAMSIALIHDLPEIYTSDLPSDIKRDNPKLVEALEKVELDAINKHLSEYISLYKELEAHKYDKLIPMIVKLADIISVYQYTNHEISIGNTNMDSINDDSVARYYDQTKLLSVLGYDVKRFEAKGLI